MDGLKPRWYGNYEAIAQLAQSLKTQTRLNPLFWIFQGSADADQAELADQAGDLRSALGHYKDEGSGLDLIHLRRRNVPGSGASLNSDLSVPGMQSNR